MRYDCNLVYFFELNSAISGISVGCKTKIKLGDAAKDHQCWERPEDMDTVRTVLKVDPSTPGTEVASETAAALAVASLVLRKSDKAYSKVLLRRAIMVSNWSINVQERLWKPIVGMMYLEELKEN